MANSLNSLILGLQIIQSQVQDRKLRLMTDMRAGKELTESEEEWLDHAGNLVDEERIVELLKNASDYQKAFECLNKEDKGVVERLQALGSKGKAVISKKRRRMNPHLNLIPSPCSFVGQVPSQRNRVQRIPDQKRSHGGQPLSKRKMRHWHNASKFSTGIIVMVATKRRQQSILIPYTQIL
jgi:hypothetical protein